MMFTNLNLRYTPSLSDGIATYTVHSTGKTIPEIANALAAPSGTAFHVQGNTVSIAFPRESFEPLNVSQWLSVVARPSPVPSATVLLEHLNMPHALIKDFSGPQLGIGGMRWMMKIKDRPLVSGILSSSNLDNDVVAARECLVGGCDIVKDNYSIAHQSAPAFSARVGEIAHAVHKAQDISGEQKHYSPQITAETHEMIRRTDIVEQAGVGHASINLGCVGLGAFQSLARHDHGIAFDAQIPATSWYSQGISPLALGQLARLAGADTVSMQHSGSQKGTHSLERPIHHIKGAFLVHKALQPSDIPLALAKFGTNIIVESDVLVHGHPYGSMKGSMALRQALDAALSRKDISLYAKSHPELRLAIEKFSDVTPV